MRHFVSRNFQQVGLAQGVLGVPGVELQYLLHRIILLNIDWQRLRADVPKNILAAGRSGQRSSVSVNTVVVEVSHDASEVQVAGSGKSSRSSDIIQVSKGRVKKRCGEAERRQLHEESNDGNSTFFGQVSVSWGNLARTSSGVLTFRLEHKVALHGEIFLVDTMLAWGVEMELDKWKSGSVGG